MACYLVKILHVCSVLVLLVLVKEFGKKRKKGDTFNEFVTI